MDKEFLEELKQEYNYKHKNNQISFSDELCFLTLATEYGNGLSLDFYDEKRLLLENFAVFLEKYFQTCEGNK